MGRRIATLWHATFSIAAGVLYFLFVLPRWWELMSETSHTLGTALRIVTGVVIALAALPVVFTLLRIRKPEYGTPQLACALQTWSIVAHVLAGVLIVGTAISEIWLSLDTAGQWLFGVYGAAAAIALLGISGFYLSFVAELPPPPPKPVKPKKEKRRRLGRRRGGKATAEAEGESAEAGAAETQDAEAEPTEAAETAEGEAETVEREVPPASGGEAAEVTAPAPVSAANEAESATVEVSATEDTATADTATVEASKGGLRNRRPTGKSSGAHRRKRSRRRAAVEE